MSAATRSNDTEVHSTLKAALAACRSSFAWVAFFSLFVNLLLLVPAIYMLQVYDRVLASGSESTLLMLTVLVVFLLAVMGALEWVRSQCVIVVGARLDRLLGERVFDAVFRRTLASGGKVATAQPLGDLAQLRGFLTGSGLFAFFDAPWLPIYVAVMFLLHPAFGAMAIGAATVLLGLTLWNELATRADLSEANRRALESSHGTERNLRNAEVIEALGMLPRLRNRWRGRQDEVLAWQVRASRKASLITAISRTFRIAIQTLVLGVGAYLALQREITPGAVIAGSILLGRALAPLDLLVTAWRGFVGARDAYQRLDNLLRSLPPQAPTMPLPAPRGHLLAHEIVVTPPGAAAPVVRGVSLSIEPGTIVAIIGPSASGKTTLVRALLGIIPPQSGTVRLDGAELTHWDRESLGQYVGYLPQDVELMEGTVGENIARCGPIDANMVVAAASAAGVHDMILHLPGGYDTVLVGAAVSAGQRQRIAIARALYGSPRLIVLDEPNSNLDQEGDAALQSTLAELKRAGCAVVVVTHRRNVLHQADRILVMSKGQAVMHDSRDKVLDRLRRAASGLPAAQPGTAPTTLRPVPQAAPTPAAPV